MNIREAVMRHLIEEYDSLPPQFDDPVGREYCLGFDFTVAEDGIAAPAEFVGRFSSHPAVHNLEWCDEHMGRILSVGPLSCLEGSTARVGSFSWVESRPGGVDCIYEVTKVGGDWTVEESCAGGLIYN